MSELSPARKRNRISVGSSHHAQELQDEANNVLVSDLQKMVNHDDYADVIFICKDGERVKAIRWLLVGRCSVLKGMLANGMKETSLSEINLPGVSSQALLCVFEFLYTGTIVNSQPKEWRLLFDVVAAAQFFLLPSLVSIGLELILEQVSELPTNLPEVAAMLTVSLEVNHSSQEIECDALNKKLVGLLSSNWTHPLYVENLSEEAFYYLLSHTKAGNKYEHEQVDEKAIRYEQKREPGTLTEYHRFRQVILWWAYHNASGWNREVEEKVDSIVPLIRDTSSLYFDVGISNKTTGIDSSLHLKSLLNASQDVPARLLSAIDLRYMHFILFEKVVQPLNCFPSSDIIRVWRFHALDKIVGSVRFNDASCCWTHGTSLTLGDDGSSIENYGRPIGSAIALMPMSKKIRIHLWQFVIEKDVNSRIEVGFICYNADQIYRWGDLDNKAWCKSAVSRMIVKKNNSSSLITGQGKSCDQEKSLNKAIGKGSQVLFQLDFVERNCSLNLDGENFGICWENLPEKDCYPVVTLGPGSVANPGSHCALVRIQTPRI